MGIGMIGQRRKASVFLNEGVGFVIKEGEEVGG